MSSDRWVQLTGVSCLVSDALWERVQAVLPAPQRRRGRGRPRVADRACLEGILYVARSGQPWHRVPAGQGFAHGKTCWRRLDEWTRQGIWPVILAAVLEDGVEQLDLDRVVVDATTVGAKKGALKRARARSIEGRTPANCTF